MTHPYPITEQRHFDESPRRGWLGMGHRYREPNELPRARAHEVLVYRVGGDYVLDSERLRRGDDQVVNATSVTVVDVSRDVPILVMLKIASRDAGEFTVQTTFKCRVTDPVLVARENLDASRSITNYLKSHQRIFQLGLDFTMKQINDVRRFVSAQIASYTTVKPPAIAGLAVALASVEVMTPAEAVEFEKSRRQRRDAHDLAAEQVVYDHDLEAERTRRSQELAAERTRREQELTAERARRDQELQEMRDEHERKLAELQAVHRQTLDGNAREFARTEAEKTQKAVRENPMAAYILAHGAGEISAAQLAGHFEEEVERVRHSERVERDRQWEREQLEKDRRRADELRQEDRDYERERYHATVRREVVLELIKTGHLPLRSAEQLLSQLDPSSPPPVVQPAVPPTAEPAARDGAPTVVHGEVTQAATPLDDAAPAREDDEY